MGASSSDYSEWNIDEKWSSQEWKSDEMLEARTGRPVIEQPAGSFTQHTDRDTIETVFSHNFSVNQLSIHEAVSDMCGEYSA